MKTLAAICLARLACLTALICVISTPASSADKGAFDPQTGNPFVPGYTADGSIFYDEASAAFYLYGTNDGNFYPNV